jgi:acyl-CoA synthetase (AMP-forming)/AMP-acid ligase II/thioesterase domain-containing protein
MTQTTAGKRAGRGVTVPATVPELLRTRAASRPDAPALLGVDGSVLTYAALAEQVDATEAALRALGVEQGDRVALVCENGPQAASAFLAIASSAVCAPLNPRYQRQELDFYLDDLDARLLVAGPGVGEAARAAAAARDVPVVALTTDGLLEPGPAVRGIDRPAPATGSDVALALHTSGTTSRPKLVPLAHRHLCASARNVATSLALTPDDRCLNVMPLFHIHGLVAAVLASLHAGAGVVCAPALEPAGFAERLSALGVTWFTAVPTMHQAILDHARPNGRPTGLRFVRSSSAALPPPVLTGLERAFGCPVVEAYGMTEAAHQMASNPLPPAERKPGSVGLPAGPEIAILSPAGGRLPAGEVGEVAIRGENVFDGYHANPDANSEAFTGGWFRTGDEGYVDDDGYLFLRGRSKEIINRGGEKVAPREVDEALLAHPSVGQAVTFARPHRRLGEDVAAAVVPRPGGAVDVDDLRAFVAERISYFKVPATILVVDEIPKGPTGKLQRIGLAERLGLDEAGSDRAAYVAPETELERRIADMYAELLSVPCVGADDSFFELGGDSLLAAQLFVSLVDEGLAPPGTPLSTLVVAPTVGGLAAALTGGSSGRRETVVPLRAGTGPPLFLIPAHDGDVFALSDVAGHMRSDRPVYALQVAARPPGAPTRSIEDIAAENVDHVVGMLPDGPFLLAGVCAGGGVALEMARLLEQRGLAVDALVLADPIGESRRRPEFYVSRLFVSLRRGDLWKALGRMARRRRARSAALRADPAGARTLREVDRARGRYSARPYAGSAVLVTSSPYRTPRSFWRRRIRGGLDERTVTGWATVYGDGALQFARELDDVVGDVSPRDA